MNFSDEYYKLMLERDSPLKREIWDIYTDVLYGNELAIKNLIRWHLIDPEGFVLPMEMSSFSSLVEALTLMYFGECLGYNVSEAGPPYNKNDFNMKSIEKFLNRKDKSLVGVAYRKADTLFKIYTKLTS